MATVRILDHLNTLLLDVETPRDSGLGKYLPDPIVTLTAVRPLAAVLQKRISEAPTSPVAVELTPPDTVRLGGDGGLALDAGVSVAVGVHQADELLFPAEDLRDAITVPGGTAYVSVGLAPRVRAALDQERGPLAFGFAAGASLGYRFYQPFDVAGRDPTLAEALAETLRRAVVPASLADLEALPPGSFASIEGEGEVQLSGSLELASVTNPLATPGLPVLGSVGISAGASVAVGAEWRASGAFEVRATKVAAGRVRLSFYRRAGSEMAIDAKAAVGITATIRDSDAIRTFLAAISSDPEADLEQLIDAGLSDPQIEALQKAVAASIDRSVSLAMRMQFSSVRRGEALVAYEVDLPGLDDEGRSAVEAGLRGELTGLQRAGAAGGAIRALQTGILGRRDRRVAWRINLFGIVNVRTVTELLRRGSLSYDPATGTLNAADEIASQRILVKTRPFEADGAKVRRLVFESTIITAAYQASRVTSGLTLRCSSSYFESRQRTTAADIRADYHAIVGLGLTDVADRDRRIGAEHDFGPSTFLVECTFDQHAADGLFLGPDGARSREYYERTGRDALLALIPAGDTERAHRRAAVDHEPSWLALTAAGPAAARVELERKLGQVRAAHIVGDYLLIRWWADAMHGAARALVAMRQFLGGRSAAALSGDPQFAARRGTLEKELAAVVKESRAQFGDPWGVLALDLAASRTARVQATLVSPRLTATYSDRILPAVGRAAALRAAGAGTARTEPMARKAERPFTSDELELLRRHAINLRLGALSTDGEFQTGEADVRRIFSELLPEELEARRAEGQKLRLLFYAHGGLTGEREGLEPVLARLKFWRLNQVYPISFVWETGLRETITDIVGGLGGARDLAARSLGEDLADAFMEVAARPAGMRVWSQMKRSAEVSVLDGGGAAFVAAETRDLWNAHHRDMEIHAVGHSAGAIFQAHFLPALLRQGTAAGVPPVSVHTLHLLAPACTTALFNARLKDLVGATGGIRALTMYTMNRSLELDDRAGPYRKSLLYLVSRAFEPEQPARILGLEESVRQELSLMRLFGVAGNQKQADLLFSKTPPGARPRDRSLSTTHGGFDDDVATMSSLMRRVLDAPDDTPIVDFFQEEIAVAPGQPERVADVIAASIADAEAGGVPPAPVHVAGAAPRPGTDVPAGGARRALCIGIDRYGAPYDLEGCVNDARNWAVTLRGLGFDVATLHDEAATRHAMLDALRSLVAGAQAGDVIVFQFAGHGTQVDDLDGDEEEDGHDEAFCPVDFADGRLLIDDDVRAVIAGLKPGVNLTCFIDCCHSGTITRAMVPGGRPASVPPGSRPRFIRYSREISARHRAFRQTPEARAEGAALGRDVSGQAMKEVCFSACQAHEVAYETAGAGQFTTKAMTVLAAGTDLTHEAFVDRVVAAFGPRPAQRPHLDCADEARARPLLKPVGVATDPNRRTPLTAIRI